MTNDIVKTVLRADPFEDMGVFRLPSLFDSMFPSKIIKDNQSRSKSWDAFFTNDVFPYDVKVHYDKNNIEIKTDLVFAVAGVNRSDINIKLDGDYLTINIEQTKKDEPNVEYIRRGLSHRSMTKKFYLNNVDKKQIESNLENGLLTITLPTTQKDNSKAINIEVK